MDELILRSLRGEATKSESRTLHEWRQASSANETHYQSVRDVWQTTSALEPTLRRGGIPTAASLLSHADASDRAAQRNVSRIRSIGRAFVPRSGIFARPSVWLKPSIAAAALLVIGFTLARLGPNEIDPSLGAAEFATGPGETVFVTLSDGSFVRLAPESRLRISEATSERREVWLDGRGFFAVAKDPSRPFYVRTRAGETQVLGTRFEVRVDDGALRVAVVEGRVALRAGNERVEVGSGEVSFVQDGAKPTVVKVAKVHELLDWPGGLLVFQATPLTQVAEEVGAHFGIEFEIADSVLAKRRVTAWFGKESFDEVLTTICRVVDARCALDGGHVTVER